jgi:hypothetical protein
MILVGISRNEFELLSKCFSVPPESLMPRRWIASVVINGKTIRDGVLLSVFDELEPVCSDALGDVETILAMNGVNSLCRQRLEISIIESSLSPNIHGSEPSELEIDTDGVKIKSYDKYLPYELYQKVKDHGEERWTGHINYQCQLRSGTVLNCLSRSSDLYYFVDLPEGFSSRDVCAVGFEKTPLPINKKNPELILFAILKSV